MLLEGGSSSRRHVSPHKHVDIVGLPPIVLFICPLNRAISIIHLILEHQRVVIVVGVFLH